MLELTFIVCEKIMIENTQINYLGSEHVMYGCFQVLMKLLPFCAIKNSVGI